MTDTKTAGVWTKMSTEGAKSYFSKKYYPMADEEFQALQMKGLLRWKGDQWEVLVTQEEVMTQYLVVSRNEWEKERAYLTSDYTPYSTKEAAQRDCDNYNKETPGQYIIIQVVLSVI